MHFIDDTTHFNVVHNKLYSFYNKNLSIISYETTFAMYLKV
jgi:hypothetical protein